MSIIDKLGVELKFTSLKISSPTYINQLNNLEEQFLKFSSRISDKSTKILMGPSFSIHEPCFIHDRILSLALRLRGASIIPIYCDQLQEEECNVYGGRWMGTTFKKACASCVSFSRLHWPKKYFSPKPLSHFVSSNQKKEIHHLVLGLRSDKWAQFTEDDMPLGQWAKDILVNNYMVGDSHLIENANHLGKVHLKNLLLLKRAYTGALNEIKPQRVVSNDSFYGMWAVLERICKQEKIDFYSHWYGGRKDGWCYAYQDSAMNLNFSKPWPKFSEVPLNSEAFTKVDAWVKNRVHGADMVFDSASVGAHQTDGHSAKIWDSSRPKALLCANVIWDCAALNKQIMFEDMIDWIVQTISWFAQHPQYDLIIKPHPSEENPVIPKTVQTVEMSLKKMGINIPDNVHLLSSKVNLSVYDLFPITKVGLMHTSTVGIEMAARGKHVVTTGRSPYRNYGFTVDPTSKEEYFSALDRIMSDQYEYDSARQMDLVYKFIYFYQFHYYSKIGIMNFEFGKVPQLLIDHIDQLKSGQNPTFDYFVESIMDGEPIISENRWMPVS